ncbi:alanine racemase [Marinibacterium sp. SX1]|uniref:alanine racemase n=1 Tax=Marinibacterium sp. SX1 TaxID=3388424 RepID=UPI003D183DA3
MWTDLETPRLILDKARLERNAELMTRRAEALGVTLRPHLKTSKSVNVGRIATAGSAENITVSTLQEAEHFARAGFKNILYATGITPNKFARAAAIAGPDNRCGLLLVTDSADMIRRAQEFALQADIVFDFLIEIDCGEHRSGLPLDPVTIVALGELIASSPHSRLCGVMTHAGHSYSSDKRQDVEAIAVAERDAAVKSAEALRAADLPCPVVSVGSTPTALWVDHLDGVTEMRCGIYLFWDLAQFSRHVCTYDDLALSVLSTVIGHNPAGGAILCDAGALALSKDIGANRYLPDAGFGYVCDVDSLNRLGELSVTSVHQEHGTIAVSDPQWFARLPVGSQIRILPNHACLTAAAHGAYTVIEDGQIAGSWPRINGWLRDDLR